MLRPNLAMDAPPTTLTVGGVTYNINVDFRIWLLVQEELRELYSHPSSTEEEAHNLGIIGGVTKLVFGRCLSSRVSPAEILGVFIQFLAGYPEPPLNNLPEEKEATCSFSYDLNYIIMAIRNQGGPDLSYRRTEPFHWWEFLLEYRALCGDHHIMRLMEIRGYEDPSRRDAKQANREAMRLKARFALPYEMTADERKAAEEFDRLTGG